MQHRGAYDGYRPDIDGLRAIAILAVVAFHAFPSSLRGGYVGVDVFFVISGFLIGRIVYRSLEAGTFSFPQFYARRVRRIFPALLLVLLATGILGWLVLLPGEFKQLGKHLASSAAFGQNIALRNEAGYFDVASELKPFAHLWSLAIEEQFYLFFPVLIWLAWTTGINVFTVVVALFLLSFMLNVTGVHHDPIGTFFSLHTRMWELLAGAALAWIQVFHPRFLPDLLRRVAFHPVIFRKPPPEEKQELLLGNMLACAGATILVISILGLHRGKHFPGWWAVAPVSGAVLLILAGPQAVLNRRVLAHRAMVGVGLISFPLYLWHWPLLAFARIVESGTPAWGLRLMLAALSVMLAWLTYGLVEKPLRHHPSRLLPLALGSLMVFAACLGVQVWRLDGVPGRLPQAQRGEDLAAYMARNLVGCEGTYPGISGFYCRMAKTGPATTLVIGDSHAEKLLFGIAEAQRGTAENTMVFWGAACLPFAGVGSVQRGAADLCAAYGARALDFAEAQAGIRTVVLASRGPLYITGKGFHEVEHDRSLSIAAQPAVSDTAQIYAAGLRATLQRLQRAGKRVVFVFDIPELGFPPLDCKQDARPFRIPEAIRAVVPGAPPKGYEGPPCTIKRSDFDARNRTYRESTLAVLKDFPAVITFDAAAPLCDRRYCWASRDGDLIYSDDDHLSIDGSRYLARSLAPLLLP